jgi:hypothetical protein
MNKRYYAVYEKVPAHQNEENGVILCPFPTEEEARAAMIKYGYNTENYYIDEYYF